MWGRMCIKYKVGCVIDPIYMLGTRYNFWWGRIGQ